YHGLAHAIGELLSEISCIDVRPAARSERHNDLHRLGGKVRGVRDGVAAQPQSGSRGEHCQKASTCVIHVYCLHRSSYRFMVAMKVSAVVCLFRRVHNLM